MRKLRLVCHGISAMVIIAALAVTSCSNPYVRPDISKAVSEEKQLEETQAQTKLMEEQVKQLTRIANALNGVKEEKPETVHMSTDHKLIEALYEQTTNQQEGR